MKAMQSSDVQTPDLCSQMPEQPTKDLPKLESEGGFLFCPRCGAPIIGRRQASEFCPWCNAHRCATCGE